MSDRKVEPELAALSPCPNAIGSRGEADLPRSAAGLLNAADTSVTSECDGSVKFREIRREKAILGHFGWSGGIRVGWGVSEVREAFVTTLKARSTGEPVLSERC
jgi:hypothetical protein